MLSWEWFWNIQDISISEYWNQDAIKKLRATLLAWKKSSNCETCYIREKVWATSVRQLFNKSFENDIDTIVNKTRIDWFTNLPIEYLDIRFSNTCNLACRMCHSGSSTWRIGVDESILGESQTEQTEMWKNSEIFTSDVFLSWLKQIYIAGWEPFLDQTHYELIQKLIDTWRSKDIHLKYNTNLTILPKRVLDSLPYFKQVTIIVSCDGYADTYEYIRVGAQWKKFVWNVVTLKKFLNSHMNSNSKITFNVVVQRDNIISIPKLSLFLTKLWITSINYTILNDPSYLSIFHIPNKLPYIQYYKDILQQHPFLGSEIQHIIDALEKSDYDIEQDKQYHDYSVKFDSFFRLDSKGSGSTI